MLYDWRTVKKNVMLPLEIMHIPKAERSDRADKMPELVGLSDFANHYPNQLSGGMQQLVGIARALVLQPEILLMDEPFSALDEFTREKLHIDLLKIWRKTNKTIIFVTHNIQESVSSRTEFACFHRIRGGFRRLSISICRDREQWKCETLPNSPSLSQRFAAALKGFKEGFR